ncbi:hypothetical protein [Streptomyces sp. GESEQ-35]|uniref:hypothetical protein n=1 Tax=Streptomyces sp. GESEQ-35 TaxID=2812657 RepID=UPI001B31DCA6|nr:hypothetical protein [Streptomyces sp. GESEQ-35]
MLRSARVGRVAQVLVVVLAPLVRVGVAVEPREVNGRPGAALFRERDGKVLNALALDILGGRNQTVRSVTNPDKLGHMGPVTDAWAVVREANQAGPPVVADGFVTGPGFTVEPL